jgi:hypothetical protein
LENGFAGPHATTSYRVPLAGARTTQGVGYGIGFHFRLREEDEPFILGLILSVIQPLSDATDGRTGNLWAVGVHLTTDDKARSFVSFVVQDAFGGGRFSAADNRHGVATADACVGPIARLHLGGGFGLAATAMPCAGLMLDVSHIGDSNNPERGRWHGTSSFDLGVTLDWRP